MKVAVYVLLFVCFAVSCSSGFFFDDDEETTTAFAATFGGFEFEQTREPLKSKERWIRGAKEKAYKRLLRGKQRVKKFTLKNTADQRRVIEGTEVIFRLRIP